MASQETQCVPRQSLLSFFSQNPTFVNLCFTHEIEIHDHEQSDDDGNSTISTSSGTTNEPAHEQHRIIQATSPQANNDAMS